MKTFLGRAIGQCKDCGEVLVEATGNLNGFKMFCPNCMPKLRAVVMTSQYGDFSESERSVCDDRCLFAKGPNCDCQCGGANHSSGWASFPSSLLSVE